MLMFWTLDVDILTFLLRPRFRLLFPKVGQIFSQHFGHSENGRTFCLIRSDDDVGGDKECAVFSRWNHIVTLIPDSGVQV